jgi:hypothetical protein
VGEPRGSAVGSRNNLLFRLPAAELWARATTCYFGSPRPAIRALSLRARAKLCFTAPSAQARFRLTRTRAVESAYLKTNSPAYETLANITLATICVSLIYVFLVVWSEIVVAIFPNLNCTFIGKILQGKNPRGKSEDITRTGDDLGGMELKNLEFSNNPMFAKGMDGGDGGGDQMSDREMVKQFKNHPEYIKMASTIDDLNQKLRDTEKRAAELGGEAKGARFKMLVHKSKKDFDFDE